MNKYPSLSYSNSLKGLDAEDAYIYSSSVNRSMVWMLWLFDFYHSSYCDAIKKLLDILGLGVDILTFRDSPRQSQSTSSLWILVMDIETTPLNYHEYHP